jgi:hypothetical protein
VRQAQASDEESSRTSLNEMEEPLDECESLDPDMVFLREEEEAIARQLDHHFRYQQELPTGFCRDQLIRSPLSKDTDRCQAPVTHSRLADHPIPLYQGRRLSHRPDQNHLNHLSSQTDETDDGTVDNNRVEYAVLLPEAFAVLDSTFDQHSL